MPPLSEQVASVSGASHPTTGGGRDHRAAWSQQNGAFEEQGLQQWDTVAGVLGHHAGQGQWAPPNNHGYGPNGYLDPQTQPADWHGQGAGGWPQQMQSTHYQQPQQQAWETGQQDGYLALGGGSRMRSTTRH